MRIHDLLSLNKLYEIKDSQHEYHAFMDLRKRKKIGRLTPNKIPNFSKLWSTRKSLRSELLVILNNGLTNRNIRPVDWDIKESEFTTAIWSSFYEFIKEIDDKNCIDLLQVANGDASWQHTEKTLQHLFIDSISSLPSYFSKKFLDRTGEKEIVTAAKKLIQTNDSWYQLFEEIHDNKENDALEILFKYAKVGWDFPYGKPQIPVDSLNEFKKFVLQRNTVNFITPYDLVIDVATLSDEILAENGVDISNIISSGWEVYTHANAHDVEDSRKNENLVDIYGKDIWLSSINTDEDELFKIYLKKLPYADQRTIQDPRQHTLLQQ